MPQYVSPLSMVERGQLWRALQLHLGFVLRHALQGLDSAALEYGRTSAAALEAERAQIRATLATLVKLALTVMQYIFS